MEGADDFNIYTKKTPPDKSAGLPGDTLIEFQHGIVCWQEQHRAMN